MRGWRVGSCDTVLKVRTGNALRFVGFGFGLMTDKTFWELLFLKELEVGIDSQDLCEPLKMLGWYQVVWNMQRCLVLQRRAARSKAAPRASGEGGHWSCFPS